MSNDMQGVLSIKIEEVKKMEEKYYERLRNLRYYIRELGKEITEDMIRPMTPDDVQVGKIVIFEDDYNVSRYECRYIEEVYNPQSAHKGFCGNLGCRYGYYGTYVLKEN